jgi:hypothetical protein
MIKNLILIILVSIISSCSSNQIATNPITGEKTKPGLFSKDSAKGISLTDVLSPMEQQNDSINVNAFLWRASLNTLSVAPLISTDALGGTIITDWYINKEIKNQRIKIAAFIKTSELRSDGINVKVHVQNMKHNIWSDTFINKSLATQIEDTILNEARRLRVNSKK